MFASAAKPALLAAAGALALAAAAAKADDVQPAGQPQKATPSAAQGQAPAAPAGNTVKEVVITAQRLNNARDTIQPETGASTYVVPNSVIQQTPGGDNAQLNQVVLQMPGVVQDSYGQLHVRGDHADIQYRFNGIILPEGLSFFGQVLQPRIADSITLITGALPAEYGLRTAGILNIKTKTGLENGGRIGVYGGSHGEWEPSIEYGGTSGGDSYYGTLSYMQNQLGVESPDGSSTPRHDRTTQLQGFGYFDHIIDSQSKLTLLAGVSDQSFQIPDLVGRQPSSGYQLGGQTLYPSTRLNQNQHEKNAFAAGSYLYTNGDFSGQAALYTRYTSLEYKPDYLGELLYTGFAQRARKEDIAAGLQAEGAYKLGDDHTVRAGLIYEHDRSNSNTSAQVFETDPGTGLPITDLTGNNVVGTVIDNGHQTSQTFSVYLQDEWRPITEFTLNYGLRYDRLESYRQEDQLSPRVNFVWNPLLNTTIHGGYARYFTPPPFELVANTTISKFVDTVAYPSAPVDTLPHSERANYFDLGVEQKVIRGLTIGIDGYWRTSKHLIDEGQFGAPIILTPFNYRYGKIHGVDLSINYDHGPLSAYLNAGYTRALGKHIESSQFNFGQGCPTTGPLPVNDPACKLGWSYAHFIFLDHNETWSSSFGAAYKWGQTKFSADGIYGSGLRATAPGGAPNGVSLPAYTVVNLSVQQHLDWRPAGPFDLRFDIVNLFDKSYQIRNGTGVGVGAPQWGARRGFFVGFSKLF